MGVPKFFRWLSERYPTISQLITENRIPEFDCLYLDMSMGQPEFDVGDHAELKTRWYHPQLHPQGLGLSDLPNDRGKDVHRNFQLYRAPLRKDPAKEAVLYGH